MLKYKTGFQDPSRSRPSPSHIPKPLWNSFGCDLAMERLSLSSIDRGPDADKKSVPADVV
jgi:hypothetical protein